MVDSKTVISQVQELQLIYHEIFSRKMELSESFQVAVLIEKLPPSWKDFNNYLKHTRKEIGLEDLIVRLRIEEDNRMLEKKTVNPIESKAHVVEEGQSSKNKKRKHLNQGGPNKGLKVETLKSSMENVLCVTSRDIVLKIAVIRKIKGMRNISKHKPMSLKLRTFMMTYMV